MKDTIDHDTIERLAKSATSQWRTHKLYEDLLQEARLELWLNYNPDYSVGSNVYKVKYRLIDYMRTFSGRKGSAGYEHKRHDVLRHEMKDSFHPTFEDQPDIIMELGIEGRHLVIARMLQVGFIKQEIAEHLNIHPSRVSQLLTQLRQTVGDSL